LGRSAQRTSQRRYLALDAFRGLAAVGVAIFHFRWTHPELSTSGTFERLFNLLDFFFVLSGFVLAHVYLSKQQPVGEFLWRRLARLYPLHVFALVMFLLLQLGKLAAEKAGMPMRQHAFAGMNFLNFLDTLFLLQSTGLLGHEISWNYPSWTVSTELIAAIVIYALVARFGRSAAMPLCIAVLVLTATYMFLSSAEPRDYGPDALIRTLYGLAMGCLLYRLHARFALIRGPVIGTIAELAGILAVLLLLSTEATRPYWYLVTFALAAVIYVFAAEEGLVSRAFERLQLHRLGTGSYSIYLNHALVGAIFSKAYLAVAAKLGLSGVASVAVYVPSFILLLLIYSRFTLCYVERPGQALMLRLWPRVRVVLNPEAAPAVSPRLAARIARVLGRSAAVPYSNLRAASSAVSAPPSTSSAS
jgi:peptidoglycan/LPS O-acetylase OafA/YrhL